MLCLLAGAGDALALNPALEVNQYAHTAWRIRDGFPRGVIRSIAQTSDGYLWLASEFGLLRFDGIKATLWEPPGPQGLPSTDIWSVLAGRDGSLWIGTAKGLVRSKGGRLTQYPELSGRFVQRLVEDRSGTVWASGTATPTGILCAVRTSGVTCDGADGTFGYGPFGLYADRSGNLWAEAPGGIWKWWPEPRTFFSIPGDSENQAFEEDEKGRLLVSARDGIRRVVGGTTESYPITPSRQPFKPNNLLRDRDGGLWIGTHTAGLVHIHNGKSDQFGPADGLSGLAVETLFEDREGNVWVATDGGLHRFREFAVSRLSVRQGLSGGVTAISPASDGGVWIGTVDGVAKWADGRLLVYRARGDEITKRDGRDVIVTGLPRGGARSLFEDDRRRTWLTFSTAFGYLQEDRFVGLPAIGARQVRMMAEDAASNIWVADQELGLFRVSAGEQVERTPWSALGHKDFATSIAPDHARGGLWLGFFNGGVAYVEAGAVRASYEHADGLAEGRVKALQIDPEGTLWVAADGGLSRLRDGRVTTLSRKNGLPCDAVHWVTFDDAGSLWANMACGLARVKREEIVAWANGRTASVAATVFDAADGVQSESWPSGVGPYVAKAADGRLWFVGRDGANIIDPRRLPFNALPPPVHIEQIIADHMTYGASLNNGGSIRLPALTHDLEIDYTGLSLVAPERVVFRYKLEGFDRDWQDVGNRRQAFYTNLPPLNYRFRVIAANNNGVWNDANAFVDFAIAPAYYQRTWFSVISFAVILGLGWIGYRIRVRIVETHEREITALNERLMKAQDQERIRIAGELHDGVMQEMLAATMMLGTAKRRIADAQDAGAMIDKVQDKLVRVGNGIRRLSHDLHPPMLQDAGLPEAVRAYCEQFGATSGIPVSCAADESASDLSRGAALALFRIMQEALGNAVKHGAAGRIAVRLTHIGDQVSLTISDDGGGFDPGRLAASGGLGLVMMRERAGQLNGTFEFESAPGRGTLIRVVVPFR